MHEFRPAKSAAGGAPQGANLVLACVGDSSCHQEWIRGVPQFDLILIYYGNNDAVFSQYSQDARLCVRQQGQKFPLINAFLLRHQALVSQYDYVWLPDDDVSLATDDLNCLFATAREHQLLICQPAVAAADGVVSHEITSPRRSLKLRFTNFVEVMMPLFETKTLLRLRDDFGLSESGWGLDISWSHRLNDPQDKMAVIDAIVARHTKPVGCDYSRFKINPMVDLADMLQKYRLYFSPVNYSCIGFNKGLVYALYRTKYLLEKRWKTIKPLYRPRPFE